MTTEMNVAMYYNNQDVRIEKQPIPSIEEDEMLVKVKASGICGSDVMEWYRIKKAPLVLGHEIAGDVVKIGKNVSKFSVGDRVFVTHHVPCNTCRFCLNNQHTLCHTLHTTKFYPGGFAEFIRVPAINVDRGTFLLPKQMTYHQGTFIEPLACVIRGFRAADFRPAQSVLVIGSGMAGLLNIKLAKAYGATTVFATDIQEYRLQSAKKMGANIVMHAKEPVAERIKKQNDGRLADFVILCAGASSAVKQALECIEPGGTLLLFAPTMPEEMIPLDVFDIWNKQITIISTYAGAGIDILDTIALLKNNIVQVDDMITHVLPLTEAKKGFALVAKAEESIKVILEPHEKKEKK